MQDNYFPHFAADFSIEKAWTTLFQIGHKKVPGLMVFTRLLINVYWPIVQQDVISSVETSVPPNFIPLSAFSNHPCTSGRLPEWCSYTPVCSLSSPHSFLMLLRLQLPVRRWLQFSQNHNLSSPMLFLATIDVTANYSSLKATLTILILPTWYGGGGHPCISISCCHLGPPSLSVVCTDLLHFLC